MPNLYQNQTDTSWGFISFTQNTSHFLVIIAYISSNINPAEQDIDIFRMVGQRKDAPPVNVNLNGKSL